MKTHWSKMEVRQLFIISSVNLCYLVAWRRRHCGVCASSAASVAACWRNSGLPAGQSQPSESVGGTYRPTEDQPPLQSLMGMMSQELRMKTRRMKGPTPSGLCDLSLSQVECHHVSTWHYVLEPGRSLMGLGCEGTWNYPWRERSSGM